ncbi:PREDICTED: 2-hydroxyisoflavanone dehydratase-like [Fragaria vesca subsp. vesca]|uniref:2-hydroxyisoflavanone dehydratase-like n=1 Tax=Fragaria vesca subsp. vesca TaxID=101020 RepID=UPI0002C35753|nr:PREDICTED: 2-hydroxyisoflavanone dehydratase-like [Fragaria vesca subsp. vesca]
MASTTKEIVSEIPNLIKHYKDGTVERLIADPHVPPSLNDPQTGVSSKDITISHNPLVSARLYLPAQNQSQKQLPIFVYFHAGGFFCSSAFSFYHHRYLNRLVSEAQVIAVSVEYRLAPESPLPAAYEDSWLSLQWVASHSLHEDDTCNNKEPWLADFGDFDRVYIGGDSAGGNISHNIAIKAGVESLNGGVKILGAILSHSGFWGSTPIGSEPRGEDFEKSLSYLVLKFSFPCADGGLDNPMINPMAPGAPSLAGLECSRLLVCVAGKDELRDRNLWYYASVKESGWKGEAELFEVEEGEHCFHIASDEVTENVKKMIKRMADFLV